MQSLLDTPIKEFFKRLTLRDLLIVIILILAVLSRLTGLGNRVMSHDEVNHVVPAYDLSAGRGYYHDPITHGPLQFHLMSLSYFLFGDNDFTSRLPHAIFSILTIAFVMVYFRDYLGNAGSLIAAVLFTISPFMLFYGRYARNDAICVFLGVMSIYAFLRYYETHGKKYLALLTLSLALNFTAKETAYIFAAQILIFVLILFVINIRKIKINDKDETRKAIFFNVLLILIILFSLAISVLLFRQSYIKIQETSSTTNLVYNDEGNLSNFLTFVQPVLQFIIPGTIPLLFLITAIQYIRTRLRWDLLSCSPAFSIMILVGTLVLPLSAPFLVRFSGMDPASYADTYVGVTNYIFIVVFSVISVQLGSQWDRGNWWKFAVSFYAIYIVLYTTFFTNPAGLMTGMVGSLGHWLNQQSVQRGGQPFYYYALFLLPIYEFLPLFGFLLAFIFGIRHKNFWRTVSRDVPSSTRVFSLDDESSPVEPGPPFEFPSKSSIPDPAVHIYLFFTSIIAYTIAGEKMPWLSLHIVFPLILTASWAFNRVAESFQKTINKKSLVNFLLICCLFMTTILIILQLLGDSPPFQGDTQIELSNTYRFIFFCLIEAGISIAILQNRRNLSLYQIKIYLSTGLIFLLVLITVRASYRAAFINDDNAKEYLVYAHAADGPKMVLDQVEEISKRKTNGLDIKVAYDNHGLYPYWWYFRHYPNKIAYLENPTRSLEEAPLIIAGQDKYAKLEPIIRDKYYYYEYIRLWWPMQDYWNLNWEKIYSALSNKNMRQALFDIWFNRDYSLYAQVKDNQNLTLETWLPSEKMRLYIRKDIVSEMWQYTNEESFIQATETDPYAEKLESRKPDGFISMEGELPGELNNPRGVDIGPDGLIYVADSRNHRIQVFSPDGMLENNWGSYANVLEQDAPGGTFNEPWDVAVAEDGTIFVADTFNHRIQKFDKNGRFIKMWGVFAQGQDPESFWGPRGIAIDDIGNVLVTDTGNKRIVVFDSELNYLTQFGGGGFEAGQFDEPVGIAVSRNNEVVVADTWNRRIQIFSVDDSGLNYSPITSFDIEGWYGQGMDNKPYVTLDDTGNIYVSDPEGGRILQFSQNGTYLGGYQDLNTSSDLISYPYGLAVDEAGNLWFSDAASNILSFLKIQSSMP